MKKQNGTESIRTGLDGLLARPGKERDSSTPAQTGQADADKSQIEHLLSVPDTGSRLNPGRPRKGDNRPRMLQTCRKTSLTVDRDLYETLCQIARDNALTISDVMNAALRKYISLYEAKHGPVTRRESHKSADSLI